MKKVQRYLKDYEELLHKPRPISMTRPQMPIKDRAAQFSPFSAVVGHEAAVKEAARYTDAKKELDEMEKVIINEKLREIEAGLPHSPVMSIVYFQADSKKSGGSYVTKVGKIKKIDPYGGDVLFEDGHGISIKDIYTINEDQALEGEG